MSNLHDATPEASVDTICHKLQLVFCRNLHEYPFAAKLSEDGSAEGIALRWASDLVHEFGFEKVDELSAQTDLLFAPCAHALPQKRPIDAFLLRRRLEWQGRSYFVWCELMQQDHFRFSLCLHSVEDLPILQKLQQLLLQLENCFHFAYDDQFGYLTANPDLAGAGFSIHCLAHLPGLTAHDYLEGLCNFAHAQGMTCVNDLERGLPPGNLFQFTNTFALTQTPEAITASAVAFLKCVAHQEMRIRQCMKYDSPILLYESLNRMRSFCNYACLITEEEALNLLSDYWLGRSCGIIPPAKGEPYAFGHCFDNVRDDVCETELHLTDCPTDALQALPARFRDAWHERAFRLDILRALWLRPLGQLVFAGDFMKWIDLK